MAATPAGRARRRRLRRWFAGIAMVLPIVGLLAVEAVARLFPVPALEDPFLQKSYALTHDSIIRDGDREIVRLELPRLGGGTAPEFPLRKASGTFRIFCLGGSASAGWPHPATETYSAYLRKALETNFPDRRFEVINLGGHAFPSFLVRLAFFHVIDRSPDAVVIFSGNNQYMLEQEYPVAPDPLRDAIWQARRLCVSQWIQAGLTRWLKLQPVTVEERAPGAGGAERTHAMLHMRPSTLRSDPVQTSRMLEHYRFDIGTMLEAAREREVPVVLMTLPVNLSGWRPYAAEPDLPPGDLAIWRAHLNQSRRLALAGDGSAAVRALGHALDLAPGHAVSWFEMGRLRESVVQVDAARVAYQKAVDLDARPLRADSRINGILRELAAADANVSLVDLAALFAAAAPGLIIGDELILDNVHPTREGNLIIAEAVYHALTARAMPSSMPAPPFPAIPPSPLPGGGVYDEDRDLHLHSTLLWFRTLAHQYDGFDERARHVLALFDEHAGFTPDPRGEQMTHDFVVQSQRLIEALAADQSARHPALLPSGTSSPEAWEAYYRFYQTYL